MGDIDALYDAACERADDLRSALASAASTIEMLCKAVPDHLWTDDLEQAMAAAAAKTSEMGIKIIW